MGYRKATEIFEPIFCYQAVITFPHLRVIVLLCITSGTIKNRQPACARSRKASRVGVHTQEMRQCSGHTHKIQEFKLMLVHQTIWIMFLLTCRLLLEKELPYTFFSFFSHHEKWKSNFISDFLLNSFLSLVTAGRKIKHWIIQILVAYHCFVRKSLFL